MNEQFSAGQLFRLLKLYFKVRGCKKRLFPIKALITETFHWVIFIEFVMRPLAQDAPFINNFLNFLQLGEDFIFLIMIVMSAIFLVFGLTLFILAVKIAGFLKIWRIFWLDFKRGIGHV